jgi:hypothetical protein
MEGEERMVRERQRKIKKVNILTIFLFNEAYAEPNVEFLGSFKSNFLHSEMRSTRIAKGATTYIHSYTNYVKNILLSIP